MPRNTRAAAPAPENGPDLSKLTGDQLSHAVTRKMPAAPKAGAIKVARIDPAKLASMTPAELKAALQAATAAAKIKPARAARPRVALTPDAIALFDQLGWSAPYADATATIEPQHRTRFNNSKGAAAYTVALAAMEIGPISLTDLARLWIASGNPAKHPAQIAQQLANRAQRPVRQIGDRLQLITD